MPGSDGGSTIGDWSVVDDTQSTPEQPVEEAATRAGAEEPPTQGAAQRPSPALRRWARLVRSFRRIRRLQRIFHNTGERLQDFPKTLRDRIATAYPKRPLHPLQ